MDTQQNGLFCLGRVFRGAWFFAFVFVLQLCTCVSSTAATIVINTETEYDPERGDVVWRISNSGDALADNVSISAVLPDGNVVSSDSIFLDGGDKVGGRLHAPFGNGGMRGKYTMPLLVEYVDIVGKSYSTIAWVHHWVGEKPGEVEPPIDVNLAPPDERDFLEVGQDAGGSGTLSLMAMPFSDSDVEASLRLLLPSGIELEEEIPGIVFIPTNGIFFLEIGVTNTAVSSPGILPAAAILEFTTSDGRHNSVEAITRIRMEPGADYGTEVAMPQKLPIEIFAVVLFVWFCLFVWRWYTGRPWPKETSPTLLACADAVVVSGCALYLGWLLRLDLIFLDTLCVGGDTPAHHYLISHIAETGKVVSWASGWWSGFPMFRYYFPLPYAVMAGLSTVIPHNIAFKLGSVTGLLALPLCLYLSGRILKLPRPSPAILACLSIPLAMDNTHSMWGVNAYSTLAGMIANSWSFAIMAPAMASACRDALDVRFRWRTVFLLSAMVFSHFFTSMMAAAVLAVIMGLILLCESVEGVPIRKCAWFVLFRTGICVFLLCAWWVLPIMAFRAWSVDFGGAWDIDFMKQLPPSLPWALGGSIVCAGIAWFFSGREKRIHVNVSGRLWMTVHLALLLVALALFYAGGFFSEVFVNCRFWPFIVYALLVISALLFGFATRIAGLKISGTLVTLSFCLAFAWRTEGNPENPAWSNANHVPFWAAANFNGVEGMREGGVLYEIADAVRGTPGRLSHDLHVGNEMLGSSRVFEVMPHLADKPILEGGIVNSALGSLAAYTVQGEVSDSTAGFPLIVKPRSFDPESGLRHLEFMGVRHFVARSRRVHEAFAADAGWRLKAAFGGGKWKLFESNMESTSLVRVWNSRLPAFETKKPQHDLLEWMYVPGAVETPAILLWDTDEVAMEVASNDDYLAWLATATTNAVPKAGWLYKVSRPCEDAVVSEDGTVRFTTDAVGQPHVVAVSYYPEWRVRGAEQVYFVTPGYIAVFPTENNVELYLAKSFAQRCGEMLGIAGLLLFVGSLVLNAMRGKTGLFSEIRG